MAEAVRQELREPPPTGHFCEEMRFTHGPFHEHDTGTTSYFARGV